MRNALYGLKQSSGTWNKRIYSFLIKEGFTKCDSEHGVYIYNASRLSRVFICLYVDELSITSANEVEIKRVKSKLMQEFEIFVLGK